jgi:PRTRC genetic system protein A
MNMQMDNAILQTFPLLAVPASGKIEAATSNGMRYLVGRTGMWREITLPWIRVRHQVSKSAFQLPYGPANDEVEFRCGPIPLHVIREFIAAARAAVPNEVAGVFLWHEETGAWRYEERHGLVVKSDYVSYREVVPRDGEHIVVDVHSHGLDRAFFSSQDDADDRGAMKLSLVLGNLDRETPSSQMRLCMAGHIVNTAYLDADGKPGVR